ncbi:hypothetical protein M404DRAFT_1003122 [Pisolithus tinctorius Marx 270]|uniref:Uncharacterized protein n=1 Tax=Pisolithus tinctorius Marx 270 TaxID=870435 RepID=A0A0C3NKG6_PISTI|nr:hypothetical protein M404DRAFT_1003122 [Pisolithus tinctorius Marx 270]
MRQTQALFNPNPRLSTADSDISGRLLKDSPSSSQIQSASCAVTYVRPLRVIF